MHTLTSHEWSDVKHWRSVCSSLTIEDCMVQRSSAKNRSDKESTEAERRRKRLVEDGYVLADNVLCRDTDASRYSKLVEKLRKGITTLHKTHSYPATFILLYDETWELARFAQQALAASTHKSNAFNFDLLAWYIDPCENVAGFSPHRDRQPLDAPSSFHTDHQAKYVTMWTALSPATPENSCLYVIPKKFDPGYTAGDDSQVEDKTTEERQITAKDDQNVEKDEDDPLSRALSSKEAFQNIRALPRESGQSVLFTHRILHWGSRGNPDSYLNAARIAISFVSSDPSFERPYVASKYFTGESNPPFRIRLLLVCAQLLIYYQRFDLPKYVVRTCYEYCKENSEELDEAYRKKVFVEFVKAMQEAKADEKNGAADDLCVGSKSQDNQNEDATHKCNFGSFENNDDDDEEEDAMLEEMLDAETGGYGEFEDDFDEIGSDEEDSHDDVDDEEEDGDEGLTLFGKRTQHGDDSSSPPKKSKSVVV